MTSAAHHNGTQNTDNLWWVLLVNTAANGLIRYAVAILQY